MMAFQRVFARLHETSLNTLREDNKRLREALESAERVFFFDLRKMRVFGPDFNQAVVDAGDRVRAALAPVSPAKEGSQP